MTAEQLITELQKMIDSHSISPSAEIVFEGCEYGGAERINLTIDKSYMSRNVVILEEE